jgi:hypothetical protein
MPGKLPAEMSQIDGKTAMKAEKTPLMVGVYVALFDR